MAMCERVEASVAMGFLSVPVPGVRSLAVLSFGFVAVLTGARSVQGRYRAAWRPEQPVSHHQPASRAGLRPAWPQADDARHGGPGP